MSLFADSISPVRRTKPDELFLLRFVAKPAPESPDFSEASGGYINCWVDADDLRTAEQAALGRIQIEQWQPTKFDHWEIVCRECYNDPESRESLEQVAEAFEYGVGLVIYSWPHDASDASDENT